MTISFKISMIISLDLQIIFCVLFGYTWYVVSTFDCQLIGLNQSVIINNGSC